MKNAQLLAGETEKMVADLELGRKKEAETQNEACSSHSIHSEEQVDLVNQMPTNLDGLKQKSTIKPTNIVWDLSSKQSSVIESSKNPTIIYLGSSDNTSIQTETEIIRVEEKPPVIRQKLQRAGTTEVENIMKSQAKRLST